MRNQSPTARDLWLEGFGTDRIAAFFRITEAEAERLVSEQRSAALGLPYPYENLELARSA